MVRIFLTTTPTVLVIELSHSFQNTVPFMCSEGAKTFTDDHVPAVPLQEMSQGHTGSLAVAGGWAGIDPRGCETETEGRCISEIPPKNIH